MAGRALDEVRVAARLDPDAVLQPVRDPGGGLAAGRVAAELGLAAQLHLLGVGRGVKVPADDWGKEGRVRFRGFVQIILWKSVKLNL